MADANSIEDARKRGRTVNCDACGKERLLKEVRVLENVRLGVDVKICIVCEAGALTGKAAAPKKKEAKKAAAPKKKEAADAEK